METDVSGAIQQSGPHGLTEFKEGWRNLLAAVLGIGLGISSTMGVSSIFFRELQLEFGWSRALAAIPLIAFPLAAIALPLTGRLCDRYGVRRVAGISIALSIIAYLWLAGMSGDIREFVAAFLMLVVLGCGTGPVTYSRLIVQSFKRRRGTALAIALSSSTLVVALLPPILGLVIEGNGWRGGYVFLAVMAGLGGGAALLLMSSRKPAEVGQRETGATIQHAIASPNFLLLCAIILLVSVAFAGFLSQAQSVFVDKGFGNRTANYMLSLLAIMAMTSRLIFGRLLDSAIPTIWAAIAMTLAAVGAALLGIAQGNLALLILSASLLAFSAGVELDIMAFFCSRYFGLRNYGALYGLLFAVHFVGIPIGGIGYGFIRDTTGSYDTALMISGGLLVLVAVTLLVLKKYDDLRPGVGEFGPAQSL